MHNISNENNKYGKMGLWAFENYIKRQFLLICEEL